MRKIHYLYADFETTKVNIPKQYARADEYYAKDENAIKPQIYSWNVGYSGKYQKLGKHNYVNDETLNYKYHYGISGDSFINFIENLKVDTEMYFNNLKGFDGHFIIPLLDKNGYELVLPFEIADMKDLDNSQKDKQIARYLKIKEIVMKNEKTKSKYYEIKHSESKENAHKYLAKLIKRRWKKLLPKEYSLMVNGSTQIFNIKIGLPSNKITNGVPQNRAIVIKDNLLLFPTSIKKMGETIISYHAMKNNLFKKELKHKEEIKNIKWDKISEYKKLVDLYSKKELSTGYSRTELYKSVDELKNDGNEFEYLIQDTFILYEFHNAIEKYFPRKLWKLTIASTSYKKWFTDLGKEMTEKLIKSGKAKKIEISKGYYKIKYKNKIYTTTGFSAHIRNEIIPTKWLDDKYEPLKSKEDLKFSRTNHNVIYEWFTGGRVKVNEKYRGQFVKDLFVLDINSSYLSSMNSDTYLPIGRGVKGNKKSHPFKLYRLIPKKDIHNKNGLPFLHNQKQSKREYLQVLKANMEIKLTSISYKRFLKHYKCDRSDYELKVVFSFKQIKGSKLFGSFGDYWYNIKQQAKKDNNAILSFIAKLFINSLYGKFGTKNTRDSMIWNQEYEEWEKISKTIDSKFYLPLAIAIADESAMKLVDGVNDRYDEFVYCDTDSLFIKGFKKENYKHLKMDEFKLGYWDLEFANGYGIVRRPKQYLFFNDKHKRKIAYSGINFHSLKLTDYDLQQQKKELENWKQITLSDYINGREISNQLNATRVMGGGVLLTDIVKSITPIWSFKNDDILTEQIYYKPEHFANSLRQIKERSNYEKYNMERV